MIQVPPSRSVLADGRDWLLWITVIAIIAGVTALASIWLGQHHSMRAKIVWTIVAIALPILGPIAWFTLGLERKTRRQ